MWKKIILTILATFIIAYGALWTFFEVGKYLGWTLLEQTGFLGQSIMITTSALATAIVLWLRGYLRISISFGAEQISENGKALGAMESAVIKHIRDAYKKEQFPSVVRFGRSISRHLFVEGFYNLRLEIGELVEDSALKAGDKESQAAALIDDIGWTLVLLRKYEQATTQIKHGLDVASGISDYYWIAKAHRHFGAMNVVNKEYKDAIGYFEEALKPAEKITDENKRKEMKAGILYDMSMVEYYEGIYDKAWEYCNKSLDLRREVGDDTRTCRIYALKGKIAEAEHNYSGAKDAFREGLVLAESLNRKDEIIRNNFGLARILKREGKIDEARHCLDEANKLLKDSPVPFDIYGQEEIALI